MDSQRSPYNTRSKIVKRKNINCSTPIGLRKYKKRRTKMSNNEQREAANNRSHEAMQLEQQREPWPIEQQAALQQNAEIIEQLRNNLAAQQAEIQRLRAAQMNPMPANNQVQGCASQRREVPIEINTLVNSIHTMNLEVKLPEFHDENSMNPIKFLKEIDRYCTIKNIETNRKMTVLPLLLHGKARIWFELQANYLNYDSFKDGFLKEFYNIPIQIKLKNAWANKRFTENDKTLQNYYYKQIKEASYLRPEISEFEKNFTIIQQLPQSARKMLATVNYDNSNMIGQILANLDMIYAEKTKHFERRYSEHKHNISQQGHNENARVRQVNVQYNTREGHRSRHENFRENYRRDFRNNRLDNNNTYRYRTPTNSQIYTNYRVNHDRMVLPDTRVPPPPLNNIHQQNNRLNEINPMNLNGEQTR